MTEYFEQNDSEYLRRSDLVRGEAVAVYIRKMWCRGEIYSFCEKKTVEIPLVRVYLVDIGQFTTVPLEQIFPIPALFITRQPSPIIRCSLHGLIQPDCAGDALDLLKHFCEQNSTLSVSILVNGSIYMYYIYIYITYV